MAPRTAVALYNHERANGCNLVSVTVTVKQFSGVNLTLYYSPRTLTLAPNQTKLSRAAYVRWMLALQMQWLCMAEV